MTIEEFYNIIRRDFDPIEFKNLKQESKALYYSEVEEKTVDMGTAYWLNIFKKHGQKGFFWSWNWAALFFPTTFSFYRRIYILWVLKWICLLGVIFVISILGINEANLKSTIVISILPVSRIFFASIANTLYLRKVNQIYNEDKSNRLQPSVLAGFLGICLIPGLF